MGHFLLIKAKKIFQVSKRRCLLGGVAFLRGKF
nr:MAG TPA: hypothetical protein [Caudoviricetes sp.]